jgi:hypothetical protein
VYSPPQSIIGKAQRGRPDGRTAPRPTSPRCLSENCPVRDQQEGDTDVAKSLAAAMNAFKTSKIEVILGLLFFALSIAPIIYPPIQLGIDISGTKAGQIVFAILMGILGAGVGSVLKFPMTTNKFDESIKELSGVIAEVSSENSNIIQLSKDSHDAIRNLQYIHICGRIQKYHKGWEDWKDFIFKEALASQYYSLEMKAWIKMMEIYLEDETTFIANKRQIRTTSDVYINLMDEIGHLLYKRYSVLENVCKPPVYRFQVTGMLPEEFYNGYQLERTVNPNRPIIFFNHNWENPDRDTEKTYKLLHQKFNRDEIKVRRCIVVRRHDLGDALISSLSSRADLEEQKYLHIQVCDFDKVKAVYRELAAVKGDSKIVERLLCKNGNNIDHCLSVVDEIIGSKHWRVYPIIDSRRRLERSFTLNSSEKEEWRGLINLFCEYYHTDRESDALYYEFVNDVNMVSEHLHEYLESGSQPEIVLFGPNVRADGKPPPKWDVGIVGRYRPFTREIKISFYCGAELEALVNALGFLIYPKSPENGPQSIISLS